MIDTGNIHRKSQGKILQLDYDFITSLEGECMYCLTDAQVQIVLGMLDYVAWPTRWFSASGLVDYETILAMQGNLGRALMSGCCDDPILGTKTDPDTGQILVTTDGTTWVPAAPLGQDPRYTAPQLPPLPDAGEEDNRCRAATNVVGAMTDKIDDFGTQLGTFGNILALASAIALAIVGVWATGGTILPAVIPIVVALAQAIYDITTEDYLALFSGAVYDDLQCILYCNCGTDGTFTEQNVLDILTDIDSTFSGNVALTFSSTVKAWQVPGLNAAARGGSLSTGDCSDCECEDPECEVTLYLAPGGGGAAIEYISDCVWQCTSISDGAGGQVLYLWFNNDTETYDPNKCGVINQVTTISGEITGFGNSGLNHCGTGDFQFLIDIKNVCASQVLIASTSPEPFVVNVGVEPCE